MAWIEYTKIDGIQQGSRVQPLNPTFLQSDRALIEVPPNITGDLSRYNVDIAQDPPVLILADSPPDSAPDSP